MRYEELTIEGRNAVMEAFRSGKTIDKLFVLDGCQDGPVRSITREARKHDTIVTYVTKERLDQMSETGKHQGVIAYAAAYEYAQVEDMLKLAEEKGEPPFLFLLDGIEDPHNLGAIIRTANLAGAHYGNRCQNFCRSVKLHSGSKSDQSGSNYGRTKEKRAVVCLRRYGWKKYVPPEFKRSYRTGNWQ